MEIGESGANGVNAVRLVNREIKHGNAYATRRLQTMVEKVSWLFHGNSNCNRDVPCPGEAVEEFVFPLPNTTPSESNIQLHLPKIIDLGNQFLIYKKIV